MASLTGECFLTSYSTQTSPPAQWRYITFICKLPETRDACGGNTVWEHKEEKHSCRRTARTLLSPELSCQDLFPHCSSPTATAPSLSLTDHVASDIQAHLRKQPKLQGKGPPEAAFSLPSVSLGCFQQTPANA